MKWRKLGRVFDPPGGAAWVHSHAMSPFALPLASGELRVYFAGRDAKSRARVGFVEIAPEPPFQVLRTSASPGLGLGSLGAFDDAGVLASWLVPDGTRIFNEYAYGGFLIHHAPGYRVFIDDRCELFGDEFLTRFVLTKDLLGGGLYENPAEPFAEWQAEHGSFDVALVEPGGGFDVALSKIPAWEVVRRTDTATLYRKSGPVN